MNLKHTTAAFGAALLVSTLPLAASADQATPASAPIRVDSVQFSQSFGILDNYNDPGLVTVAFTNESAVPATRVVFALEGGGDVIDRFTDVGTYRRGVKISNDFSEVAVDFDEQLAVESVSFADGTTWTNALPMRSRRQSTEAASSTPAPLTAEQIRETSPNSVY